MEFLPENYQPPVSNQGNYFKTQQGVNLIRVLSKPLLGWEIWIDEHPKRYPHDEMPESSGESKPREFWSVIVWNYELEKIQVWNITQGSIKKTIMDLAKDTDWGAPCQYDLKITRSGQQLKTNYAVTPTPKKPLSQTIRKAFDDTPIWLPALYTGDDPFAQWGKITPMLNIEPVFNNGNETISEAQYQEIVDMIGDDKDYLRKVTDGIKKNFSVDLKNLPFSHYEKVLNQVKLHVEERLRKEMDDDLPF